MNPLKLSKKSQLAIERQKTIQKMQQTQCPINKGGLLAAIWTWDELTPVIEGIKNPAVAAVVTLLLSEGKDRAHKYVSAICTFAEKKDAA